jgi:zinc transporter 1
LEHDHATIRETRPNKLPSISITNGEREPLLINVNGSTTPIDSPTITMMSPRRGRSNSVDSISLFGHPIQNRQYIISKAEDIATTAGRSTSPPASPQHQRHSSIARSILHRRSTSASNNFTQEAIPEAEDGHSHEHNEGHHHHEHNEEDGHSHANEDHSVHKHTHHDSYDEDVEANRHGGHSHGNMNMHALLLHVLGDALGNVGVISSGLIIWQTTWWWRYYSDPMISLFITIIIFSSALPLVKSASFILLQG